MSQEPGGRRKAPSEGLVGEGAGSTERFSQREVLSVLTDLKSDGPGLALVMGRETHCDARYRGKEEFLGLLQ